jgi:hypothetical protein
VFHPTGRTQHVHLVGWSTVDCGRCLAMRMWSSLPPGAPTQTPALPGWTRAGSRGFRQPMEQVAPGYCLAYKARWQDGIKAATYYTRGWTYQESHFAKRSFVFLDERSYSAASAPTPGRNTSPRPQTRYGAGPGMLEPTRATVSAKRRERSRRAYSDCQPTYPQIYNAFAGISSTLTSSSSERPD